MISFKLLKLLVNQAAYINTDVELCAGHLSTVNSSVVSYTLKGRFLNRNTFHSFNWKVLLNFDRIIPHLFSQFHDLGIKINCSEANRAQIIPANQVFFFKFRRFSIKQLHIFKELELKKFKNLSILCYNLWKYHFTFWFVLGLNSILKSKNPKQNLPSRMIIQDSWIQLDISIF